MKNVDYQKNIILIGMPGAGKSTVGVVLAKKLGYEFLDSDLVIQKKTGKRLQEILEAEGTEGFNRIENDINISIEAEKCVIATGGSAIYGKQAMKHFQEMGVIIYLQLSLETIEERLGDIQNRGVSTQKGQTLEQLYQERIPFYEKYANITINCENLLLREVVELIAKNCII